MRLTIRTLLIAALGVAVLAAPALAAKGKRPSIQSTSFAASENESTMVEAGVSHAKKVTLTVGKGAEADRFELERTGRESGLSFWTTEVPDREAKCAPVRFVARGPGGFDEDQTRVCTFGPASPEPPELTPDLP